MPISWTEERNAEKLEKPLKAESLVPIRELCSDKKKSAGDDAVRMMSEIALSDSSSSSEQKDHLNFKDSEQDDVIWRDINRLIGANNKSPTTPVKTNKSSTSLGSVRSSCIARAKNSTTGSGRLQIAKLGLGSFSCKLFLFELLDMKTAKSMSVTTKDGSDLQDQSPETVFKSKYKLLGSVGVGGAAQVFDAICLEETKDDNRYVVKVANLTEEAHVRAFRNERTVLGTLPQNPYCVRMV